MERVIKKTSLKESQTDLHYWLSKTPIERLESLEFLRQQYYKFNKNVSSRLQRVLRVIKQK
jgi:hypothetical protein